MNAQQRLNEHLAVRKQDSRDLKRWDKMAQANGKAYGIREIILSPKADLTREQALRMAEIALEAHQADGHNWALVVHYKDRGDGTSDPHFHLEIEERNLETGNRRQFLAGTNAGSRSLSIGRAGRGRRSG